MATVPIPISRSVRITRTAISPRLAIKTLRNIVEAPIVATCPVPTARIVGVSFMALDSIEGSLKERGVRLTRQRQILLELIDKTGEHLDAERLFQMAKERDPKLNRVTVYRTLKMLKEGGLVDELDLMHYGGDQHYYETRLKQEHAHVICLRCGKVEEFFGEPLQRLRKQIESHFGFQVLLARTEVGGYCAHCQTLRAREVEALREQAPAPAKRTVPARPVRARR